MSRRRSEKRKKKEREREKAARRTGMIHDDLHHDEIIISALVSLSPPIADVP